MGTVAKQKAKWNQSAVSKAQIRLGIWKNKINLQTYFIPFLFDTIFIKRKHNFMPLTSHNLFFVSFFWWRTFSSAIFLGQISTKPAPPKFSKPKPKHEKRKREEEESTFFSPDLCWFLALSVLFWDSLLGARYLFALCSHLFVNLCRCLSLVMTIVNSSSSPKGVYNYIWSNIIFLLWQALLQIFILLHV